MTDAVWRRGYELLRRFGLRFDLQTPWWHLHEAAQLARAYPDTQIILNHTGLPADRSAQGLDGWKRAMTAARAMPQCGGEDFRHRRAGQTLDRRRQSQHRADRHRSVRRRPLDVRQQFSGRQPVRDIRPDFRRLPRDRAPTSAHRTSGACFATTQSASTRWMEHDQTSDRICRRRIDGACRWCKRLIEHGYRVKAYDIVEGEDAMPRSRPARRRRRRRPMPRATSMFVLLNLPTTDAVETAVFGADGVASAIAQAANPDRFLHHQGREGKSLRGAACKARPDADGSTRRCPAGHRRRAAGTLTVMAGGSDADIAAWRR